MSPRDPVPMEDAVALQPGSSLHEYRVDRVLGSGGFGVTYLATDTNLNAHVAIKEYLPSEVATRLPDQSVQPRAHKMRDMFEWGLKRFIEESRTLATFHHPAIVRVLRFFEANNTAYMVMEFVSGDPLNGWIKSYRPLPQDNLLGIVSPLLEGLDVVHKTGFLHRDIKPGNVYIREDGKPVLLDFGAARATRGAADATSVLSPGFAPFEQYSNGNQGPWTDIYALGAVLYWMVTGNKPPESIARVRKDLMVPAVEAGSKDLYSLSLLSAIDWSLKLNEDERPQTVVEFRKALLEGVAAMEDDVRTVPRGPAAAARAAARPTAATPSKPNAASAASPATGTFAPGVTLTTIGAFDRDTLKLIATELALHVGPMATVLTGRAAKVSPSLQHLAEKLAEEIPESARSQFVRKIMHGDISKRVTSGNTVVGDKSVVNKSVVNKSLVNDPSVLTKTSLSQLAHANFSAEVLERAEKRLAQYLGAIASVVVRRTAVKARDEAELYLLLADQIQDKTQRSGFVRKAMSMHGGKED
jgi:serine/threonine protein kinase